jgi:hypothetical protein
VLISLRVESELPKGVHYRVLYFLIARAIVISHSITKEVPPTEIDPSDSCAGVLRGRSRPPHIQAKEVAMAGKRRFKSTAQKITIGPAFLLGLSRDLQGG